MSFQAYIDNIKEKTGKTPEDFHKLAKKAGLMTPTLNQETIKTMTRKMLGGGTPI